MRERSKGTHSASLPSAAAMLVCIVVSPGCQATEEAPRIKAGGGGLAALATIDYFATSGTRIQSAGAVPPAVRSAVAVLAGDTSFGADARLNYASHVLGDQSPAVLGAELHAKALSGSTSKACCAEVKGCELALATPSGMESAIWFRLDVPRAYQDIAKVLDPQSWSDMPDSGFLRTERQNLTSCPTRKPNDVDTATTQLGESWCDVVYEKFEYFPGTDHQLVFDNALFFRTVLDPPDPADSSKTLRRYDVSYGICPGGSYGGRWRNSGEVSGGILRDSGCSSAADLNGIDNGRSEKSAVEGVKRLKLSQDLCANGQCVQDDADFLNSVMRTLVVGTRIAACSVNNAEGSCEWPVPCGTEHAVDSGQFDCGFSDPEDFECDED